MKDINIPLVEYKRPPIYTAMKYWGKKPHNIWRSYIENYTNKGDVILDPFAGSAIAAFEAVKCGRKAISFDLNPLTSFIIEVYSSEFDVNVFQKKVDDIVFHLQNDIIYKSLFNIICEKCSAETAILQHIKWNKGKPYEYGIVCPECKQKYISTNLEILNMQIDINNKEYSYYWYPNDDFHISPSFTDSFIKNIGGNNYKYLWTNRNIYVLSYIFNEILKTPDEILKKQLLFGFIQIVHLSSKMCIPRSRASNRDFSTSWGRAAYICSSKQMEMNPLLLFEKNCKGKQSVSSALGNIKHYLGKTPVSVRIDKLDSFSNIDAVDIIYGVVDVKKLTHYVPAHSVKFVITDPPYGGLVQYLDLSNVWLVWLKHYDNFYKPDFDNEITLKTGITDIISYTKNFSTALKEIKKTIASDGKFIITFHNKNLQIWNAFFESLNNANLKIENVILQYNRRTGESNVSDANGMSASDLYIRCSPNIYSDTVSSERINFEEFVVHKAVNILSARNEPTPYNILFSCLLVEITKDNIRFDNISADIYDILTKYDNVLFEIKKGKNNFDSTWNLLAKNTCDKGETLPLTERINSSIMKYLEENNKVDRDSILEWIYSIYSGAVLPDIKTLDYIITKQILFRDIKIA